MMLLLLFTFQFMPQDIFALTGGPSQPEVSSFQPIGVSDMVDLFSGDFQYNLPLLDIDGYPINLSYASQLSTDMESSWVGLGWNLNPGAITRSMRGIPDEFKGDIVRKENNVKPNKNISFTLTKDLEKFGLPKLTKFPVTSKTGGPTVQADASLTLTYNNYTGFSLASSVSAAYNTGESTSGSKTADNTYSLSVGSSASGLSIKPDVSFNKIKERADKNDISSKLNVGLAFSSRGGLQQLSFGAQRNKFDIANLGDGISIGLNSYTPYIQTPMQNTSLSFSYKAGSEYGGIFPSYSMSGTLSWQRLKQKVMQVPAYGYQYTELAGNNAMMDINREKDGSFTKNTPILPLTNYTYDLFSVNGQGISGTFRPFRAEVGNVFDKNSENTSLGVGGGVDIGFGNAVKNGFNINVNVSNSNSGKWDDHYNNSGKDHFRNRDNPGIIDYETYAYKQLGEITTDEEGFVQSSYKGSAPLRMGISAADFTFRTNPSLLDKYGVAMNLPSNNYKKTRIKRNQQLSILTRSEVERFGLENNLGIMYPAPSYHPGEMTVLKDDGARYVYGIAAYNYTQEETTFNTGRWARNAQQQTLLESDIDRPSGLVRYGSEDNSMENNRGNDNYYSNTVMPAFAHSFLLTAILSTDYVDIDGVKGPSKGDIGNYTKFTYTKLNKLYKWRAPFQQYMANLNEGLYTDLDDNQGNYTYGEKEQWYLSTIETKNSIAVFTLEDRKDGYGVIDKNGGMGDVTTKLLRKITLYSKPDYDQLYSTPTPIKVVNFEYNYNLCPGVPNNDGTTGGADNNTNKGKLTLSKIYFTYGNSLRGKFSPYEFEYNTVNPSYGVKDNDRWGNYKPNNLSIPNNEFPYVEQNQTSADNNAQAWTLKRITLPSGGKINVFYESDDYAYVQDQNAMQMFKITSFVRDLGEPSLFSSTHNQLISGSPGIINNQFMIFKLNENFVPSGTSPSARENDRIKFRQMYLKQMSNMYFRIKVDLTSRNNYEYVSGYCEFEDISDIDKAFMISDGSDGTKYTHGYLKVKHVDIGDHGLGLNVHPMAKAAWQYGRMNLNRELYGSVDDNTSNVVKLLALFRDVTFLGPLLQALQGQNGYLMDIDAGKSVDLSHSFVRLYHPTGKKLGGGLRVKKITISDQWQSMIPAGGSSDETEYGQEYSYTTTDAETGLLISSGVASNEPSIGADENPLRQPLYFGNKEDKLLAPDDRFYLETPIGESFYPNASIGYSRVTVKNLGRSNVTRHATGYVINEFYTAKDFPTIVQNTPLEAKQTMISPLLKIFKKYTRSYMVASQGFSIELNDMHGKPKAVWVYAENSDMPISGTEYRYQCTPYQKDANSAKGYRLTNSAQVLYPDGTIKQKELGVEYDIVNDFRQETTASYAAGFKGNLDNFMVSVMPLTVPSFYNDAESDKRGFRSAVMTKVVNRYGLVEEVIAYDLGSKVGTKNLTYDSETGNVILTQTKNEFEDDIYSFTYPAHWYYDNMGPAYKNYKISFTGLAFDPSGYTNISNASNWFVPGDEIISGTEKGWVTSVSASSIGVINEIGQAFKPSTTGQDIVIVRSGRRNILKANVGSLVSMSNPLNGIRTNAFSKVINAASQVFRDDWKTYCECFAGYSSLMKISSNPYATGRKGIWRPFKSYTFLTNREVSVKNNNVNIRNDGSYTNYSPYWKWNGSAWVINGTDWTWTSEITEYSPFGMELENKDPLNRYSAATYGYNNSLPMSVAANAKYADIGFDGFEDYNFSSCSNDHFSYKQNAAQVSGATAHTGLKGIRVTTGTNVTISKQLNCSAP